MKKTDFKKLNYFANFLRKKIIEISYKKKTHHVGSCLSSVEILISSFFNFLKFKKNGNNDFFIFSKGHAALAYYIVLMMKKFFSEKFLLENYLEDGGVLGGHPDRNPNLGIDYCSGSLGNGLSVGCGVALFFLMEKKKKKVLVILGDGECNEGMIWESALFAAHHKLYNLYVILDYNKMQGFGKVDDVLNLKSLKKKFESFNWKVIEINGHNLKEIHKAKKKLVKIKNKPKIIIANTVKGKGIKSMENRFESHYNILNENDIKKTIYKL